jgi:hypothetical protein
VSGVLTRDSLFYDPEEPKCPADVQPTTLVELEVELPQKAVGWLEQDGRVFLDVEGTLYGPEPASEFSKELPVSERIANWENAGYGSKRCCRTKLVVKSITRYERVSPSLPQLVTVRPDDTARLPSVVRAALPTYPPKARLLSVEGSVSLTLRLVKGEIVEVRIVHADDPILAAAARENVLTWRFRDNITRTLSTTFVYELERRTFPGDDNEVVEAHLPAYVRIVGPRLDW